MKRQFAHRAEDLAQHHALLVVLAEDLSLPLTQIKTGLELLEADNFTKSTTRQQSRAMNLSVEAGLQILEAYRLLLKSDEIMNMAYETVAIGAILEEAAHQLTPFAREYATKLEVDIQGKLTPVLVHKPSLQAAIQSLGYSFIRAQTAQSDKLEYRVVFGAHRGTEKAVATGVFSDVQGLSDRSLRAAHSLVGRARQPLPAVPPGAASGILIADRLCTNFWQPLRSAAHHHLHGLVTTLPTSKQIQFV